ncbi:MAG: YdcF family protein [Pseudomonadota bacterium]
MTAPSAHRAQSRVIAALLISAALILAAADFSSFARRVGGAERPDRPSADAVVSLTGGSTLRIRTGVELVAAGAGERLLVSGVNPQTTMDDIRADIKGEASVYECCVDLGWEARTTIGNATEASAWAEKNGYGSLIIVTSDYHMPRSLIELQRAMPDIRLSPYPVRTAVDPTKVWTQFRSFRGVLVEWTKWRATKLRRGLFG